MFWYDDVFARLFVKRGDLTPCAYNPDIYESVCACACVFVCVSGYHQDGKFNGGVGVLF